jgi:hypothetical protein
MNADGFTKASNTLYPHSTHAAREVKAASKLLDLVNT